MSYNRNLYSSSESAIDAGMIYDQTEEKLQSEINAQVSSDITELDGSLSTFVRPNLLDNWYFVGGGSQLGDGVFPINQRGEGSYEPNQGNTFLIDRWSTGLATGKLQLHAGSMSGTNNFLIEQSVGKVSDFGGKTLTISILTSQGLISSTDVCPTTAPASGTTNMRAADIYRDGTRVGYADVIVNTAGNVKARIRVFDGYIVYFWAIKLELGSTQTLAHQENGVWVLNEIPNWEEEYRKCYGSVKIRNADIDATSATYPSYGNTAGVLFYDKNSYALAMYADRHETDGSTGAIIGGNKRINNSNYWNYLRLLVKPDGTKVVMVTDPAAWRAAIGALNKAGDTMTGQLTIANAPVIVQDRSITSGTTPSSNIYGKSYYLNDSNGFNIATWQIMSLTDGREGFQLVAGKRVNNVNKFNYIRMNVDANGNPIIELSSSAAWRKALNLCYAVNDTYSTSAGVNLPAIANGNSTIIYMSVHVDKSMENISTVTVTSLNGWIAGPNGAINGSASSVQFVGASGYTVACTKLSNYMVRIQLTKSSAFTNSVNNGAVVFFGTLTLKFT